MNKLKKVCALTLFAFIFIFATYQGSAFAASVGDVLDKPEQGWIRHNYDAKEITYSGGTWSANVGPATYASQWQKEGANLKFNFTGTQIRLISTTWWSFSKDIDVFIDGNLVEKISLNGVDDRQKRIKFEKLNLPYGEHSIEFVNNTKEYVALFGFDTDGELSSYKPIENKPEPVPTDPTPVDPTPDQPSNQNAILIVTMMNGLEKEYDLPMNECFDDPYLIDRNFCIYYRLHCCSSSRY